MYNTPIEFSVRSADENHEHLAITVDGRQAGKANVTYQGATAQISAHVDLRHVGRIFQLDLFHHELATELMAYVLNRGAMAQESEGKVTYEMGRRAQALALPSHQEAGLGHPNSW